VLLLCDISLYSVVKQRLKCNPGKVLNCLIQFVVTVVLSIEERVFLVDHVLQEGDGYSDLVLEQFAEKFLETPVPHRNAVCRSIEKFRETSSALDVERSGRPSKLNGEKLMDISDSMLWSPSKSLRKLAQEEDIGLVTPHKAVREKLKLFPYKVTAVQGLKPADLEKRIRYCEWFTKFIQTKTVDILNVTVFTDEAWLHFSVYVNTQNTRLWSSENPHALHEKALHDQKLGVWVVISRRCIVGPLFFEESVHSKRSCSMLHDFISLLEENEITYSWFQQDGATVHIANNSMKLLSEIFGFQQDGATAHIANNSMKLLNEIFRERVISSNLWPPCSPILTPPDFHLWGAAKYAVYHDRPCTLNALKTAVTAYINITQADLQEVFANKIKWVQACIDVRGRHFQHFL